MTVTVIREKCRAIQYKGDELEPERSTRLGLWLHTSTNCICKCYYFKIVTIYVSYVVTVIANTCCLLL